MTNLQGDITKIIDENGSSIGTYAYDAWGKVTSISGTVAQANPLRYRGYYFDQETGFYHLGNRYYAPEIGRFVNADSYASTGQGLLGHNMFVYCGNCPILRIDTYGEEWEPIGVGVQLELSVSSEAYTVETGIEVVLYWGTEEALLAESPVVAIYAYGGGSLDADIFSSSIDTAKKLLTQSSASLRANTDAALSGVLTKVKGTLSADISVSGFLVLGNEKFKKAEDYTKGFTVGSIGVGKYKFNYAKSDRCMTIGIGRSMFGLSSAISIHSGKYYYGMLYSSAKTV